MGEARWDRRRFWLLRRFRLPNGAIRSPDASWVRRDRWQSLSKAQQESFAHLCPDFVVELRSPSDAVAELQQKMIEYLDNGARAGILIDPFEYRVYVYRAGGEAQMMERPAKIAMAPEFPELIFNMAEFWD